jgi:hypothetical protein
MSRLRPQPGLLDTWRTSQDGNFDVTTNTPRSSTPSRIPTPNRGRPQKEPAPRSQTTPSRIPEPATRHATKGSMMSRGAVGASANLWPQNAAAGQTLPTLPLQRLVQPEVPRLALTIPAKRPHIVSLAIGMWHPDLPRGHPSRERQRHRCVPGLAVLTLRGAQPATPLCT